MPDLYLVPGATPGQDATEAATGDRTPAAPYAPYNMPRADALDAAVPLDPDRLHDKPAGPHVGPAAALNVPCSEGPSGRILDRGEESDLDLMAAEPSWDPLRAMEAGSDWYPETVRELSSLDRPIQQPAWPCDHGVGSTS